MAETVAITTVDLEPAVRMRDGFQEAGLRVELLTSHEGLADVDEPILLVLTGALHERRARALVAEATERELPVLALVSDPLEGTAEAAHRLGVSEVLAKPIDAQEAVLLGRRLIDRARFRALTGIVGETEPMREVVERVVQIAPVAATVLITGESGTGKELVARGIHALSPRRHQPFVAVNFAALPETLLESELFGHEKGAFTGAVAQRKGRFELADGGTLFLDEIGEHALRPCRSSCSACSRSASSCASAERLHPRRRPRHRRHQPGPPPPRRARPLPRATSTTASTSSPSSMPPLRDRVEDIPLLVERFIRSTSLEHDRPQVSLSPEALDILMRYDWPGNVRELRNLVESMVVLAPGRTIRPSDIPAPIRDGRASRLLPVHVPRGSGAGTDAGREPGPELEFIFHTLVQMRIDMEELRRQFEEFRRRESQATPPRALPSYPYPFVTGAGSRGAAGPIEDAVVHEAGEVAPDEDAGDERDDSAVVFRPGMSMQEMEREAIIAVLKEVRGNRRRAAEMLGIGERTLYRKIKEYDIPL